MYICMYACRNGCMLMMTLGLKSYSAQESQPRRRHVGVAGWAKLKGRLEQDIGRKERHRAGERAKSLFSGATRTRSVAFSLMEEPRPWPRRRGHARRGRGTSARTAWVRSKKVTVASSSLRGACCLTGDARLSPRLQRAREATVANVWPRRRGHARRGGPPPGRSPP